MSNTLATTIEEMRSTDFTGGKVVNGVDSPNFLSVDSTTPLKTDADSVEEKEEMKEEKKEEKSSTTKEKEQEKSEKKDEENTDKSEKDEKPAIKEKDKDTVKRIGTLTKKWRTAERERDYERQKRVEAENELKKLKASIPATDKPSREDFDTVEEYADALSDWKIEKLKAEMSASKTEKDISEKETEELRKAQEIDDQLSDMKDRGIDAYDDFETVVYRKELELPEFVVEIALLSEIPEHILYYLGKNPDTAAEISTMSPAKAAKELGKIEVEVAAKLPKPNTSQDGGEVKEEGTKKERGEASTKEDESATSIKKKTTKAPDPIDPPKSTGDIQKSPEDMSPKEYRAWREGNK